MTFFDQLFSYFSESFGIGLTTEDIVDRLLSTEYSKTGKQRQREKKKGGGTYTNFFF